jgi:hypothetical protein
MKSRNAPIGSGSILARQVNDAEFLEKLEWLHEGLLWMSKLPDLQAPREIC